MNSAMMEIEAAPRAVMAPQTRAVTPADLLRHALDSGADLDRLEKLMDLQDRWEANEARKAFADSMAEFKLNPPTIYKDKHVSFKTDKGRTEYDHATIGNVNELVIAALASHGFSHRWIPQQADGQVIVTCVITHRLGHKEETTLKSAPDSSGGKNGIQSIVSAMSYLERHSLLAAVGLATKDQVDDDGAAVSPTADPEPIMAKNIIRTPIAGKAFDRALASITSGEYTVAGLRHYYTFTPDQEIALADVKVKPT